MTSVAKEKRIAVHLRGGVGITSVCLAILHCTRIFVMHVSRRHFGLAGFLPARASD